MAAYLHTTEEMNQEYQAGLELESEVLTHADSNTPEKDHIELLVQKVEDDIAYKPSITSVIEDGKFQLKLTPSSSIPYEIKINVNGEKTANSN